MTEIVPVSKERHQNQTWRRPENYLFAARDTVAPLVSPEVPRAIMHMAVGFIAQGESFLLVAIQGLEQGRNKFVSQDGRWLGDYVPAIYRARPFQLARNQEGAEILCIDEAMGQVSDSDSGEPFFMPDGAPARGIAEASKLLIEIERDQQRTQKACEVLAQHDLLEPWPLEVRDGNDSLQVRGLFRTAESRLYTLEPPALTAVRDSGALMIAFAQLFSMQQVHKLGRLQAPAKNALAQPPAPKLSEDNGIISFANL